MRNAPIEENLASYSNATQKVLREFDQSVIDYELLEDTVNYLSTASRARGGRANGAPDIPEDGAILVFMPGIMEIQKLSDRLRANPDLYIVPLHSSLSSQDQKKIFSSPPRGQRKVVLATNIAETSITIDDVAVVVDTGRVKEMRYDGLRRMGILEQTWVSQASATQRQGRAGRVRNGCCVKLFSRSMNARMAEQTTPEIKRVPLEELILQIELLELGDPTSFLMRALTPPKPNAVRAALQNLVDLSALSIDDASTAKVALTPLGFHLASLPLDARLGKMLIFASIFKCLDPVLTIAATMSVKSPFVAPMSKQEQADKAKRRFAREELSDHFAWWHAYDEFERNGRNSWDWCSRNFLSMNTLQTIRGLREQLRRQLKEAGFARGSNQDVNINSANLHLIRCVLSAGLYPNVARTYAVPCGPKGRGGKRTEMRTKTEVVAFHPSSVNGRGPVENNRCAVYLEKIETSRIFLRDSTVVSPFALLLFGGPVKVDHDDKTISVDDWITVDTSLAVGVLCKVVRHELNDILLQMVERPKGDEAQAAQVQLMTDGLASILSASHFENNLKMHPMSEQQPGNRASNDGDDHGRGRGGRGNRGSGRGRGSGDPGGGRGGRGRGGRGGRGRGDGGGRRGGGSARGRGRQAW